MKINWLETITGTIVLFVFFFLTGYAWKKTNFFQIRGYVISAHFENVEGVHEGSDVRISGIKVGQVKELYFDNDKYKARIVLELQDNLQIPVDSTLAVVTEGIMGGKYLKITPGIEKEYLKNGDYVEITSSAMNLESLIGKFLTK